MKNHIFPVVLLTTITAACSGKTVASNCQVAFEANDGSAQFEPTPNVDLSKGLSFTMPTKLENASSILCERSELKLTEVDFLAVSAASKPIMIRGDESLVVVEMVNGQFRLRTLEGELSEEQINAAQTAMNEAQSIIQNQ